MQSQIEERKVDMYWKVDMLTDDQPNWYESAKGNWCRKDAADEVIATVFRNGHDVWQIIMNREGSGRLVANEYFPESVAAMDRAEAILHGAACRFLPPK